MACEIPCVVTDVGDCAEIVGQTGRVVQVGDMSKFANEVIDMLSRSKLQRQAIGRAARLRVKALYDIDKLQKHTVIYMSNTLFHERVTYVWHCRVY